MITFGQVLAALELSAFCTAERHSQKPGLPLS